jgi:hypothetical protein
MNVLWEQLDAPPLLPVPTLWGHSSARAIVDILALDSHALMITSALGKDQATTAALTRPALTLLAASPADVIPDILAMALRAQMSTNALCGQLTAALMPPVPIPPELTNAPAMVDILAMGRHALMWMSVQAEPITATITTRDALIPRVLSVARAMPDIQETA